MKKILLILFLGIAFSFESLAQSSHSTSFDDRPACEEVKGVWRQFGNGCADQCSNKFDPFIICTQALSYGCDCGKSRCWNGETCVSQKSYKKIFDAEKAKEDVILAEAKKKRQAAAQENQDAIMSKLLNKIAVNNEAADLSKASITNVASEPVQASAPVPAPAPVLAPVQQPSVVVDNAKQKNTELPPFFVQQEKERQAAIERGKAAAIAVMQPEVVATTTTATPVAPVSTTPVTKTTEDPMALTLPGLPVIPLPGS